MLLLGNDRLGDRRAAAAGPLGPLAASLAADLEPLLARQFDLPDQKAQLSKEGGRCSRCRATLAFAPLSPDVHRCPLCGREHHGPAHHRWWLTYYHLWLAERAVHGAVLYALGGDAGHRDLARRILANYADRYLTYPNRDNVLGPTRLFFSTYLESIWLLQICIAADILAVHGAPELLGNVCDRVVIPSAALIAQFDEGQSNRQVWNNAALLAASGLTGDHTTAERIVHGPSGLLAHLTQGLLPDGTWYEGENYHLFAHRGLWYGLALAEEAGLGIDAPKVARFDEGFATPFLTALPDLTMPSRKDSPHAVSLRQWRVAESCELGLARRDDARLRSALARLYEPTIPTGDTGRARSAADVEQNQPPVRLTRADLGWRALLFMMPELRGLVGEPPQSVSLPAQGVTVFRRGDVYVALDWGASGGGHGHPDRLNLLFAQGDTRWLDDLGTGSYVDSSLHWYRSTLAHNAPLVDGRSQERVDGTLLTFEDSGDVGRVLAAVDIAGVHVERAVIVASDYFVDQVRWTADRAVRFELPVHFAGATRDLPLAPGRLDGRDGLEDGFGFVGAVRAASVAAATTVALEAQRDGRQARVWCWSAGDTRWFQTDAVGQPVTTRQPFYVQRAEGTGGVMRAVWTWSPRLSAVRFTPDGVEVTVDGKRRGHALPAMSASSKHRPAGSAPQPEPFRPPLPLKRGVSAVFDLGETHYRRSEETWQEAGRPTARVSVAVEGTTLVVEVTVPDPLVSVPADAVNAYDNEHPDINGHGVQCYLRTPTGGGAWLAVPEPERKSGRVRRLPGWGTLELSKAAWRPESTGFAVRLEVPLLADAVADNYQFALDVLVNETVSGRERRRGQLVLSGATGEFVYLRGDRHDPTRLVRFAVAT